MIKISIIVPVYNVELYLSRCLDTIINQTLNEIEIILVNDGSSDNSLNICRYYESLDSRIIVIDKKNEGVSSARNEGLKIAGGEYIGFVDPDDWIDFEMYESMYTKAKTGNYDVVMCNYIIQMGSTLIKNKLQISKKVFTSKDEIKNEIISNMISPKNLDSDKTSIMGSVCRCIFKNKIIKDKNIYFIQDIDFSEDLLFCINIFIESSSVFIDEEYHYHYCYRDNSAVSKYKKNFLEQMFRVNNHIEELLIKSKLYDNLKDRLNIRYYNMYFSQIFNLLKEESLVTNFKVIEFIKKFCDDDLVVRVVKNQKKSEISMVKRMYLFFVKHKMIYFIFLYHKLISFFIKRKYYD